MILYVETNFFLEVALAQEQSDSAVRLLELAENGSIVLCFPTFCLGEAFAAIQRRASERQRFYQSLQDQSRQLARSTPQQRLASELGALATSVVAVNRAEANGLDSAVFRIVRAGGAIELSRAEYDLARSYASQHGLDPQDAIVLACVISHLVIAPPREQKLFVSRDAAAFATSAVQDELELYSCVYLATFDAAFGRIDSMLRATSSQEQCASSTSSPA